MADGNPDLVAFDLVVLRHSALHTPAEEDADAIIGEPIVPDDGTLRTGTGMKAEARVVFADAVLDDHIVADLPADAVAVVVPGGDAGDMDAVAVLQEDAARVVAIEFVI